ncbi:DUF975 family protein [Lacticaseibacillus sp. GG6-2]
MNDDLLKRSQIKQRAKAQLRQNGVWGQMMVANIIPWLITVAFTLLTLWGMVSLMSHYGIDKMATDPAGFATYYSNNADSQSGLLKSLVLLWFGQGIAFTALDLYRGKVNQVRPMQTVFRLFNSKYFFGVLAVAILVELMQILGFFAFFFPMILAYFGLSMSFYAYYDGKEKGRYAALAALGHSWRIMRGFKLDYFVLKLSLLGWEILKAITWHLFDFMIDPYLQLVDAGFYQNVQAHYQRQMTA